MSQSDAQRLIAFQQFLLDITAVERATLLPGGPNRRENDSEHGYGLAMAAWFLAPSFPELDVSKLIRVALAHDVVEVHAGDTPAFGPQEDIKSKEAREDKALAQLKADWADFPDMLDCIEDYKYKRSAEARFLYALDKLLPAIINYLTEGGTWHEYKVTFEAMRAEKERKIPKDSLLWPYYEQLLAVFKKHPEYFEPGKDSA